ncbi:NADH-quinone oxidoreductase subunit L [Silanimonas lenta]|uniref:NADH-quinone oxidoreductase subunit L n=1 Tax=Silanimonas lenta TaxID=265429 RepID=UPI000407B221|nr:NADH-quinone oxidoreductase subunit L [Silanimonas lenta]
MENTLSTNLLLVIAFAPLLGSIIAGLFGRQVGRAGAHTATIVGVAISCALSIQVLWQLVSGEADPYNRNIYTFFEIGGYSAHVGFMVDRLTAMMMVVVTFVSLLVHVYTIGYMEGDPGYQRFFSYISLFTFSMLMLVMSNNFLQLFFGWEAVGLVSYLLIGFWYKRPSAVFANMKAFLVNRVGDFGFLLGIGAVLYYYGSLDYAEVFAQVTSGPGQVLTIWEGFSVLGLTVPAWQVDAMTFIGICLFIGAMGKSAQVPLHVWLPDSMEGPTPISALIHAATMVTAGIFMVSRMSPVFELSPVALQFILFIGATTALFTGLIGMVQNDIKRVVAYSTLSQLGYMTVALGVSAYGAAVFHLMTHAFFKALLFLAAGSVIIGMHHEQDMRKMGGLRKYMPITYWTSLIGTLALVGFPFFSGFYSKDGIIEAVKAAGEGGTWVNQYAIFAVLAGVFVTSFYSFRLFYLTFHGEERFRHADAHGHDGHHDGAHDDHGHHGPVEPHESPWVVTVPLLALAIPSVLVGLLTVGPMLFGKDLTGTREVTPFFQGAIEHYVPASDAAAPFAGGMAYAPVATGPVDCAAVEGARDVLARVGCQHFQHGAVGFALHGFVAPPFWLAFLGFALATFLYLLRPGLSARFRQALAPLVRMLEQKYWMDHLWVGGFGGGGVRLGKLAWKFGDRGLIDGALVNGSAWVVDRVAAVLRHVQSGYLYHYAFAMIVGLIALMWLVGRMLAA